VKARAVFLDRDGTLIEDPGYLNDPALVRLRPGAGPALARLKQAGFRLIVVTNQSGIARGLISPEQYRAVADRTAELLAGAGGGLDAQYHCPHLPALSGPCDCRKPGLLLFRRAIDEWSIDPTRSWWVGDRPRDVTPAKGLGGRGILVRNAMHGVSPTVGEELGVTVAEDIGGAADRILASGPASGTAA
jgi:histidinol-phosphate phosphatase family protein